MACARWSFLVLTLALPACHRLLAVGQAGDKGSGREATRLDAARSDHHPADGARDRPGDTSRDRPTDAAARDRAPRDQPREDIKKDSRVGDAKSCSSFASYSCFAYSPMGPCSGACLCKGFCPPNTFYCALRDGGTGSVCYLNGKFCGAAPGVAQCTVCSYAFYTYSSCRP